MSRVAQRTVSALLCFASTVMFVENAFPDTPTSQHDEKAEEKADKLPIKLGGTKVLVGEVFEIVLNEPVGCGPGDDTSEADEFEEVA